MYTVTSNPMSTRTGLAKWVRSLRGMSITSVPQALMVADDLLNGCRFELYLSAEEKAAGDALCTITEIVVENPWKAHFDEQARYHELCTRGAAGDVEAAIAFCKLEVEGKVSHGAIG